MTAKTLIPKSISRFAGAAPLASATKSRRSCVSYRRALECLFTAAWLFEIAALGVAFVWVLADGRFPETVSDAQKVAAYLLQHHGDNFPIVASTARVWLLCLMITAAIVSLSALIAGLVFGSTAQRRLRLWFALTALVAGWLSLTIGWRDVAWFGQKQRLTHQIDAFETIAMKLRSRWPIEDGSGPETGSYMAYPQAKPSMLLVISPAETDSRSAVSSVERSPMGGLRFELAGAEAGAWIEWHPLNSKPSSFVGGLATHYHLVRSAQLAPHWFVTVYTTQNSLSSASTSTTAPMAFGARNRSAERGCFHLASAWNPHGANMQI